MQDCFASGDLFTPENKGRDDAWAGSSTVLRIKEADWADLAACGFVKMHKKQKFFIVQNLKRRKLTLTKKFVCKLFISDLLGVLSEKERCENDI